MTLGGLLCSERVNSELELWRCYQITSNCHPMPGKLAECRIIACCSQISTHPKGV